MQGEVWQREGDWAAHQECLLCVLPCDWGYGSLFLSMLQVPSGAPGIKSIHCKYLLNQNKNMSQSEWKSGL